MLALVLAASLSAADVPPPSLADGDRTEARLIFLSERLHEGATAAQAWYWTWTAIYSAATIGQAIGFFLSQDLRGQVNWAVGAATTFIGVLLMMVTDFPAAYGARELDRMPAGTPEQRRAKLRRAEELLEGAADAELGGRAWYIHVGGAAVSLAGGLILWLAYGYLLDGIINAVAGFAATELQIWTQPTRAIKDWQAYRDQFGGAAIPVKPTVRLVPMVGGVALAGAF